MLIAVAGAAAVTARRRARRHDDRLALRRHSEQLAVAVAARRRLGTRCASVLPSAVAFALLGAIESLLSAVVADGMTGRRHRSNCELVAQGVANVASGLFGGICVTGTIARTATNVRAGAHGPVAGMLHSLFLLAVRAARGAARELHSARGARGRARRRRVEHGRAQCRRHVAAFARRRCCRAARDLLAHDLRGLDGSHRRRLRARLDSVHPPYVADDGDRGALAVRRGGRSRRRTARRAPPLRRVAGCRSERRRLSDHGRVLLRRGGGRRHRARPDLDAPSRADHRSSPPCRFSMRRPRTRSKGSRAKQSNAVCASCSRARVTRYARSCSSTA